MGESEEVTCPGSLKINCDTAVAGIHLSIGKKNCFNWMPTLDQAVITNPVFFASPCKLPFLWTESVLWL